MMARQSQDLIRELTELHSDQDTTNFNTFDFVSAFGSPLEAMAYASLFWPDFVQIDEMIFRSDVIEDESDIKRVREALRKWNGDLEKTELSFNRLDVPCGIFGKRMGEGSCETDDQLAQILTEMWAAKLAKTYPDFMFSVVVDLACLG